MSEEKSLGIEIAPTIIKGEDDEIIGITYKILINSSDCSGKKREYNYSSIDEVALSIFVSTDKIRKMFQTSKDFVVGKSIRIIEISFNHDKKTCKINSYYPINRVPENFKKRGIASLIELVIEIGLINKFPDYSIKSTEYPSELRKIQLIKRGRKVGKKCSLGFAVRNTKQYIEKKSNLNKNRRFRAYYYLL